MKLQLKVYIDEDVSEELRKSGKNQSALINSYLMHYFGITRTEEEKQEISRAIEERQEI